VRDGTGYCVAGNHDVKLARKLNGRDVKITHGLAESLAQLEGQTPDFRRETAEFLDGLVSHYVFDQGKLVVAHPVGDDIVLDLEPSGALGRRRVAHHVEQPLGRWNRCPRVDHLVGPGERTLADDRARSNEVAVDFEVAADPPTMTLEVDITGNRYVENRDTTAVLAGSRTRRTSFTERWTLALSGDDRQPWRIVSASAPVGLA